MACIMLTVAFASCGQTAPEVPEQAAASESAPVPAPSPAPASQPSALSAAPARYEVESVDVKVIGAEAGLVRAGFSVEVRNLGEQPGDASTPVEVALGGGMPEAVQVVDGLLPGEVASLTFERELPPGNHQVAVKVADSESLVRVDARVADIVVEPLEHKLVGSRAAILEVEVGNRGDRVAEAVVLSSRWTPDPSEADAGGAPGSLARAAVITDLTPGESRAVAVPLYPETGTYTVTVNAETDTIEAVKSNNSAAASVAVEYVQLSLDLEFIRHKGYEHDGRGIVEIGFVVKNDGLTPSGQVQFGMACEGGEEAGCSETQLLRSINPGSSVNTVVRLSVAQGQNAVTVFAGAPDDSYRWGDGNVVEVAVDVPERLATHLVLDAESRVAGYWSDNTANVEITVFLRNEGYRPVADPQPIGVSCKQSEDSAGECEHELQVQLTDGFSPTSESLILRLPVGLQELVFDYGGEVPESLEAEVPSRILGVRRDTWDCFSDRPGLLIRRKTGDYHGGCAGWGAETIKRWPQDEAVKVWVTGSEDYLAVLEEVLEELSPVLDLEFQWVESKDEADFTAYVGVPVSSAEDIGFGAHCADALGCARSRSNSGGEVTQASIAVWSDEREYLREMGLVWESVRRSIVHEALHALLPIHHRNHPASIMNIHNALRLPYLSPMDQALFRLHSHPLVQPGMTMGEVEELIVFGDQLMDSPNLAAGPDAYELVRGAFVALQEAGSAGFKVRGAWTGRRCGSHTFGSINRADYEIQNFGPTAAYMVHFRDGGHRGFIVDSKERNVDPEYWMKFGRGWRQVGAAQFFDETAWARGFSSPHRMLASILFFADAENIRVSQGVGETLTLKVDLRDAYTSLEWSKDETLKLALVVDEQTHHIREYRMDWQFTPFERHSCGGYWIEAREGKYAIEIEVPDDILEGSRNLP